MAEDQITQPAVTETPAPAQPGATAPDARNDGDDLDRLLSEYDGSRTQTPPAPASPAPATPAAADTDIRALTDEVRGLRTERQKEVFRRDMDAMVKDVRGDLDPEYFDDTLVEAYIDAQARQDPRLLQVFADRHVNPKQFAKVVETLGRSFTKKYSKLPDKQATEDRDAVTAAVRGASNRAPPEPPPNFSGQSNAEYRESVKQKYGYIPRV